LLYKNVKKGAYADRISVSKTTGIYSVQMLRPRIKFFGYRTGNTDKKESKIFLIYKEIQMGSGAKSNMRRGFLI
jgi:hypothetical protein